MKNLPYFAPKIHSMKIASCALGFSSFILTSALFFSCSKKDSSSSTPTPPPTDTTHTATPAAISGVTPAEGPATTQVTITGANFGNSMSGDSVFFNGKKATIVSATTTQIVVTVPLQAGTGKISVFTNGASITGPNFTYDTAWFVSTFAGTGTKGFLDGTGTAASFDAAFNAVADAQGNLYITDRYNNAIRKMTPAGVVTTLAGGLGQGSTDGTGIAAKFYLPTGLAIDANGNIYVADEENNKIRMVTPAGVVTTLAGSGLFYSTDGTGSAASFTGPLSISIDGSGNLLVVEGQRIRKCTPAGVVTTVAGNNTIASVNGTGTAASFAYAFESAIDGNGNLYVVEGGSGTSNSIRKITPAGVVTTFAGNGSSVDVDGTGTAAGFNYPVGITADSLGNLYVTEFGGNNIRKITPNAVVTTIAGAGYKGSDDGLATKATFNSPSGVTFDNHGNIYVMDAGNYTIRKLIRE